MQALDLQVYMEACLVSRVVHHGKSEEVQMESKWLLVCRFEKYCCVTGEQLEERVLVLMKKYQKYRRAR